jgi:DNA-binding response OmpR family regulator/anti-sigma regulatory factor (Ser/Thr protein kinase)
MPKILVIEDDENFSRAIIKYLLKKGFEVEATTNGQDGLVKALQNPPDLVVCDLMMPGMDGFEVLASLRKNERLSSTPIIFLTGLTGTGHMREGMNKGADDYLTKPLDMADLVKAINARLERHQLDKDRQEKQTERAMRLFSGIIHDLRDPLFVVLGCADKLGMGTAQTPDASRVVEQMHEVIGRMQSIVTETMFLVRSRMQRLPFDPASFDLREFCEQVLADHDQASRLKLECAPGEYPAVADSLRLRLALDNLLSNALKYSTTEVTVCLNKAVGGYELEVKDHGIGIPAEDQPGIFEPFFRASNTDGRPGHGLGLSIVKSTIEQHGGRIRFASAVNRGTTITIELPAVPPKTVETHVRTMPGSPLNPEASGLPAAPAPAEPRFSRPQLKMASAHRGGNIPGHSTELGGDLAGSAGGKNKDCLTALVVDDDPLVRGVLRDYLEKTNEIRVVAEAGTLQQARALVRQLAPKTIFLDVHLPDGQGFDLLSDIRSQTAVIFVTSTEEYAVHAFDCEATDYLVKPISFERLQKTLVRVKQRLGINGRAHSDAHSKLEETFLVKTMSEKRLVKIREINRITAYGEYTWVYWAKSKGALLRKSLKQWQLELPVSQFVRVHRRAIINLEFMERIEKLPGARMQVHMRDVPEPILVSLRLAASLNRKLKAFHA